MPTWFKAAAVSLSTLALPIATHGQETTLGPSRPIEEIIVTAQKWEQSASTVGMSITAATGDTLQERGIDSVANLTRLVPGLTRQESSFNSTSFTLRGVGFFNSDLATPPAVTIYVDEAPLPYPAMTKLAAFDLQRVEVLKGPQGTLFGQNATGGAVNYIANKPTSTFEAGITADYGRFDTASLEGYVSGPLGDAISARLALSTVQGDGWQRGMQRGDELGGTDEVVGRLLVDFHPTDTLAIRLNANGWRDRSDSQAPQHRGVSAAVPSVPLDPQFLAAPLAPDDARAADWDPGF